MDGPGRICRNRSLSTSWQASMHTVLGIKYTDKEGRAGRGHQRIDYIMHNHNHNRLIRTKHALHQHNVTQRIRRFTNKTDQYFHLIYRYIPALIYKNQSLNQYSTIIISDKAKNIYQRTVLLYSNLRDKKNMQSKLKLHYYVMRGKHIIL